MNEVTKKNSFAQKVGNGYRAVIRKFNNFRFSAFVMSGVSLVAGLYALASFFLYHFAGDKNKRGYRNVGFSSSTDGRFLGMAFFFGCLFTIILSIFVVYTLVPHMLNKDKQAPIKANFILCFVSGIFQVLVVVLNILLIGESPKTVVGIIAILPFGILAAIGSLLMLWPFIKCEFYMPAININK